MAKETVMREGQVTQGGLVNALVPEGQEYGHFNQDGPGQKFDGKKLVGQSITAQNYKDSGLAKSAATYVDDIMKYDPKLGAKLMAGMRDIDGDGKVDKKDLAAAIVAASMDANGKFDNGMSTADMGKLLDPKQRAAVLAAAATFAKADVAVAKEGVGVPSSAAVPAGHQQQTGKGGRE